MVRWRGEPPGKLTAPAAGPYLRGQSSPVLGANLNERPRHLRGERGRAFIEHSNTKWVRAFIDVRAKQNSDTPLEDDPDIQGLRNAAQAGCGLIVSLKWDFEGSHWTDKEEIPVPNPGSEAEVDLFATATACLNAIGEPVDYLILGNEPMWETADEDVRDALPSFTLGAKGHFDEYGSFGDPDYLVGAFNQFGDNLNRSRFGPFVDAMLGMLREDSDIVGVDVHTHFDSPQKARSMLSAARETVNNVVGPDGMVMDTEFSPVWRYKKNLNRQLSEFDRAAAFCDTFGLDASQTVVDYLQDAKQRQISREEYRAFLEAMPWYSSGHLTHMYSLFEEFDVAFGGWGFIQGPGMQHTDWASGNWDPFHINFNYQQAVLKGDTPEETGHVLWLDDYRQRSG